MMVDNFISALGLPVGTHVNQRVPKTLLIENGAATPADKRQIRRCIEELSWIAILKPATIGVPPYRDDEREYLEIAIIRLTLRDDPRRKRLIELVHRAIPYPVLLVTELDTTLSISLSHKRASLSQADQVVLDGDITDVQLEGGIEIEILNSFLESLPLSQQPRASMYELYQGWTDTVIALKAARVVGVFANPDSRERATKCREALEEVAHIDAEIKRLRGAAKQEKQLGRRVELNEEIHRMKAAYEAAKSRLY